MACKYDLDPSRAISIVHAAQQWQKVGGSVDTTVVAVAVAMAESGLDPYATSSTCARGLWQIEDESFIAGRPTAEELFDTYNNAFWAHSLSNGGTYWSPWDSCFATIARAAQRYTIRYPEVGSPAFKMIPVVANAIGDASDLSDVRGAWLTTTSVKRQISMVKNVAND